jgi:thiol-disulfide isomerase/thioredoxin
MAGNVLNIKVCSPLKQRSGLTGKYHAICHYSYNLPLPHIMKKPKMKQSIVYLLLILIGFSSCRKPNNEVILKGKISGDIPEEISYSVPVNGICYEFFSSTAPVDSLGNFQFSLNPETICFASLYLLGNRGQFIINPGETYNLAIESKDFENKIKFNCRNKIVQEEYQNLISPIHPQFEAMNLSKLSITIVQAKIDSSLHAELKIFKNLQEQKSISKQEFDLITLDRTLFYSSVLGQVAMLKYTNTLRLNMETNTDSINEFWNKAISAIPLESENLTKSKWAYYYIENYLLYKEYVANKLNREARRKAKAEGKFHTHIIDIAKKHLGGEILEFYWASYIQTKAYQKKFEKELINLYEEFVSDFPTSNYMNFIEPHIEKIVDFHKKAELDYNNEIRFLENYQELNSLSECLKSFQGKKVYVDIWATSCGPCKKEFGFNKELKDLLKSNNTDILYISTDRDSEDKRWKDMIKYYQLSGNHVRANKELKADLRNILGRYGIPRYLLIDNKGKITSSDASRPSELNDLEKQLSDK